MQEGRGSRMSEIEILVWSCWRSKRKGGSRGLGYVYIISGVELNGCGTDKTALEMKVVRWAIDSEGIGI